jgi:hypothetical protein
MDTNQDDLAPLPEPSVKKVPAKVGDPGEPTVAEWHAEIENDLKSALAKMALLPANFKHQVARVKRAIEVHLTK